VDTERRRYSHSLSPSRVIPILAAMGGKSITVTGVPSISGSPFAQSAQNSLTNHLLIAMPSLSDPNFSQTVALICEHTEKGALGIVLNKPLNMRLSDVLSQMKLEPQTEYIGAQPVLRGGPVHTDRGFVLHRPGGKWDHTHKVSDTIQVTTSRDVLAAMARGEGPSDAFIALGYANWDSGQLEREMRENAWLTVPVDARLVFDLPFEDRWAGAWRLLGIQPERMSPVAGHA
jgi:putative transcriptional regulator